jgi:hypothetical protein
VRGRRGLARALRAAAATVLLATSLGHARATRAAATGEVEEQVASRVPAGEPVYDATGALLLPQDYREWVFVGASLGLSYAAGAAGAPDAFHHVYLRPDSYATFRRTGRFPDRTVLVLELYEAAEKASPSRHGTFEGRRLAVEAAVKDARLADGWAYFSFEDGPRATAIAHARGSCFECHRQHAAVDNVFVQFYPVLRDGGH